MQCNVTYAIGMYYLYKVSSETYILNFECLSSIDLHLRERGCEDSLLFSEAKKDLRIRNFGKQ